MEIFKILHHIGIVLGFGGAAVSSGMMLFIQTDEKRLQRGRMARRICLATWTGLVLLILSGISLTIDFQGVYKYILAAKHLFVAIIVIDAFIIHFRLFPRYFRRIGTPDFDPTYSTMRRIGVLSMSCWILTIILSGFLGR